MIRLKIISDGRVRGTKVVNAETGEALEGVVSLRWEIDAATNECRCELTMIGLEAELLADMANKTAYVGFTLHPPQEQSG